MDFAMGHGRTPDMPALAGRMASARVAETVLFVLTRPPEAPDPRGCAPPRDRDFVGGVRPG